MTKIRTPIGGAMLWVAAIGANLAALRWLIVSQNGVVLPAALIVAAIQIAIWMAARGPSRFRWFCMGFVASAAVWPSLFAWVHLFPESSLQESWPFSYLRWSMALAAERVNPLLAPYSQNIYVLGSALAVIAFLPQLFMAFVGGLVSHWVIRPVARPVVNRRVADAPPNPALQRPRPAATVSGDAEVSPGGPVR